MKLPPEIENLVPSEQDGNTPPDDFRELNYKEYTPIEWQDLGFDLVDYMNSISPNWINYSLMNKGKRDQRLTTQILPDMLGDEIIHENLIKVFSQLPQGAIYQPKFGAWKLFQNKELESYVKYVALKKITEQTAWDRNVSNSVADYVLHASYDDSFTELPFDVADPNKVAFTNGTFNFLTGELEESNPENYIMNAHNYDLDTSNRETPVTDAWLVALFGDENARFIKEFIGYLFYRSYDYAQIILILKSEGGRGKSTFLNYLRKIVGGSNTSNLSLTQLGSSSEFNSSGLYQKSFNYFSDIGPDFLKSTELIKALSGNDEISMQVKGGNLFQARNVARLVFSANKLPSTKIGDSGLQRRIRIIPVVAPKVDAEFKVKYPLTEINKESSAFVYSAMMAFKQVKEQVDGQQWGLTQSIVAATQQWQDENDPVKMWLMDSLENGQAFWGDGWVLTKEVYPNYQTWAVENGFRAMGKNTFFEHLERLRLFKHRIRINGKQVSVWELSKQQKKMLYPNDDA